MDKVTTYAPVMVEAGRSCSRPYAMMQPAPSGQWVKLEDYQTVLRKLEAIAKVVGVEI